MGSLFLICFLEGGVGGGLCNPSGAQGDLQDEAVRVDPELLGAVVHRVGLPAAGGPARPRAPRPRKGVPCTLREIVSLPAWKALLCSVSRIRDTSASDLRCNRIFPEGPPVVEEVIGDHCPGRVAPGESTCVRRRPFWCSRLAMAAMRASGEKLAVPSGMISAAVSLCGCYPYPALLLWLAEAAEPWQPAARGCVLR